MTLEDQLIEEAAYIWLNERDDQPCSIRRARLRQMCSDLLKEQPSTTESLPCIPAPKYPRDWQMLAANNHTLEPEFA